MEVKLLNSNSILPKIYTEGAAAVDLSSIYMVHLLPKDRKIIHTGISLHIFDKSLCGIVTIRSSLGVKGLILSNSIGIIDSDYQGEILLNIYNSGDDSYLITENERIAQLLFIPIIHPNFKIVKEFSMESDRGSNSFGSTGK